MTLPAGGKPVKFLVIRPATARCVETPVYEGRLRKFGWKQPVPRGRSGSYGQYRLPERNEVKYDWILDFDATVDVRDGYTRTAGNQSLNPADGDAIYIENCCGAKFNVRWVAMCEYGKSWVWKRAYLLRDNKPLGGDTHHGDGGNCIDECATSAYMAKSWRFTFAGLVNNACTDCNAWNRNWILIHSVGCLWATPDVTLCGTTFHWEMNASVGVIENLYVAGSGASFPGIPPTYTFAAPFDPVASNNLFLNTVDFPAPDLCTGFPASLTLTPVLT